MEKDRRVAGSSIIGWHFEGGEKGLEGRSKELPFWLY